MTEFSCLVIKKKWYDLSKPPLGFVTDFYAPIWVIGFCVLYHQTIIFLGEMFVSDKQCDLKSTSVSEIHFPMIWGSKFQKFSPWCPTDSSKYKETQSLEKKHGCREKCLDKKAAFRHLIFVQILFQVRYFVEQICKEKQYSHFFKILMT